MGKMKDLSIDQMNTEREQEMAEIHQREVQENQAENSMRITVVEIDEKELFIGAKVKNINTGQEFNIIRDDVRWFDMNKDGSDIHVSTVLLNKQRFELLKEED